MPIDLVFWSKTIIQKGAVSYFIMKAYLEKAYGIDVKFTAVIRYYMYKRKLLEFEIELSYVNMGQYHGKC